MSCEYSTWQRVAIAELIESGVILRQKDGNYGSKYPRASEFGAKGIPFLTASSLADGEIDIEGAPRLPEHRSVGLEYGFVEPNDVLLSHNATVGRVAIVPDWDERLMVGTSLTYYRVDTDRLLPGYLAAYFVAADFQNQLAAVMSHTTRNQVPITAQRHLEIVVPPMAVQRGIAHTLGSINSKIANNRALAADLEAMARAIFKSWFVDFDPVKAKMEGRAPAGMDADTAALFPDEIVESELGLIPKGWEAMPFEEAFDFTMGQSPPGSELNEQGDGLPFFQGSADFNTVFPSFRVFCPTPRREANGNDVLFSVRAPVGDCNIAKGKCGIGRGLCAIRSKFAGTGVTYPWMKSITADLQRASGEGVVFSSLSKAQLASCPVVVAPVEVYKAADRILSPILNLMANLDEESISLASTRDALLPRLISGKLRVPDMPEALSE